MTGSAASGGAPESARTTARAPAGDPAEELKIMAVPLDASADTAPGAAAAKQDAAPEVQVTGVPDASGAAVQAEPDAGRGVEAFGLSAESVKVALRGDEIPAAADTARGSWMFLQLDDRGGAQVAEAPADETVSVQTLQATPPEVLDLNPLANGNVVVVNRALVQVVDAYGNRVVETAVDPAPSAVAFGPSGESAVVTSDAVLRFTAEGMLTGSIRQEETPALVAVSGDRTALADSEGIKVYVADSRALTLPGLQPSAMAMAPDGALALLTGSPQGVRLQIYSAEGQLNLDQAVVPEGEGFGFLAGGRLVAVGSALYDRNGGQTGRLPIAPSRVSDLAGGQGVLAWNSQQVARLEAGGATARWVAEVEDGSILQASGSARGDLVVILASTADGPALWVIDESGNRRYAERLAEWPADATAAGDQILLLTAEGLMVRNLNR